MTIMQCKWTNWSELDMGIILSDSAIYLIKNKEMNDWIPYVKSLGITIIMLSNLVYFFPFQKVKFMQKLFYFKVYDYLNHKCNMFSCK